MNEITMKMQADQLIRMALQEDITSEDVSTNAVMPTATKGTVELIAKEDGVIAGLDIYARVFTILDEKTEIDFHCKDGDEVKKGELMATVTGDIRVLLSGERVALNYLQRMSGIATYTRQVAKLLEGSKVTLLDTRKTTPNCRVFEKYAVRVGGGCNHRYNLSDGVLLKDNHIGAAGSVTKAVQMAKTLKKKEETQIEKEVAAVLEAEELLKEVPDILGCDMNYDTSGVELKAYLSDETSYIRIKEGLRAEILEDGPISLEDAVLLWLLRESGCIHDLFSVSEQNRVEERMTEAAVQDEKYRALWEAEFHNVFEGFMNRFVKTKSKLLKNPYLEGVNLVFPYLDRRKSVFIDMVIFGTNVADRRAAAVEYLKKKGFAVEEIRVGSETLLKIGNIYYRIFPMTKTAYKVPIQGVNLVPAYWQ